MLSDEYKKDVIANAKKLFHKPGVNSSDWDKVKPELLILIDYVISHCETYNLPLTITSIIRPKIKGISKSVTHQEGRAFDISVRGWSHEDIRFLVDNINEKFTIGAISLKDGKEREAIYEDGVNAGTAPHLHFQVGR
ncbi:MAG: hypothetical protein AB7I27_00285 [Bacteriovoracaceae bacterium]